MKLYSYIVKHDTGFAPNPFWGCCTLACCKPAIRRTAQVGDWIVGLSTKSKGNSVVYVMEVSEKMTFEGYFKDKRFKEKIPNMFSDDIKKTRGDNIYKPQMNSSYQYRQLPSRHSDGGRENKVNRKNDLGGIYVLVSKKFWYFGADVVELPSKFSAFKVGIGHRNRFPQKLVDEFVKYMGKHKRGRRGYPEDWSGDKAKAKCGGR